jgi:hypothetical protein
MFTRGATCAQQLQSPLFQTPLELRQSITAIYGTYLNEGSISSTTLVIPTEARSMSTHGLLPR